MGVDQLGAARPSLPGLDAGLGALVLRYSTEAHVRSGRALCYQGDPAEAAYILTRGRIRPLRLHGSASSPLRDMGPGSWLYLPEAWLGLSCMADTLAVEACELRKISLYNLAALRREPVFVELAAGLMARSHYELYGQLEAVSAAERVARAVAAACSGKEGPTVSLELSQSALADSLGLSRETVNRCLKRLEDAGFLETARGCLLVYDVDGLKAWED